MKQSISILILLGLTVTEASSRHRGLLQLNAQDSAFLGEPVGGRLLQLWSHGQSWDETVGVVDADSYASDVRDSLAEQTPTGEIEEDEVKPQKHKQQIAQAPKAEHVVHYQHPGRTMA